MDVDIIGIVRGMHPDTDSANLFSSLHRHGCKDWGATTEAFRAMFY